MVSGSEIEHFVRGEGGKTHSEKFSIVPAN